MPSSAEPLKACHVVLDVHDLLVPEGDPIYDTYVTDDYENVYVPGYHFDAMEQDVYDAPGPQLLLEESTILLVDNGYGFGEDSEVGSILFDHEQPLNQDDFGGLVPFQEEEPFEYAEEPLEADDMISIGTNVWYHYAEQYEEEDVESAQDFVPLYLSPESYTPSLEWLEEVESWADPAPPYVAVAGL